MSLGRADLEAFGHVEQVACAVEGEHDGGRGILEGAGAGTVRARRKGKSAFGQLVRVRERRERACLDIEAEPDDLDVRRGVGVAVGGVRRSGLALGSFPLALHRSLPLSSYLLRAPDELGLGTADASSVHEAGVQLGADESERLGARDCCREAASEAAERFSQANATPSGDDAADECGTYVALCGASLGRFRAFSL